MAEKKVAADKPAKEKADKNKWKIHASGEWVGNTFRLPTGLNRAMITELARRLLRGEYGIGWKEMPSKQAIVVEVLANHLGVTLPPPDIKEDDDKLEFVFMCYLPKEIQDALTAKSLETGESKNSIVKEALAVAASGWKKLPGEIDIHPGLKAEVDVKLETP